MARPYSKDLRDRVVRSVVAGRSCRATAALFGVSVAVVKWSQRFRATGSAAAYQMGGRKPLALRGERVWLLQRIATEPDLTLRAVHAELAARHPRQLQRGMELLRRPRDQLQKKPARQRARSPERGLATRPVEEIPGPA